MDSGPLPIAEISGKDRVSCARERKVEQPKVHHGVLANDRSGSRDIGCQNTFRGFRVADFHRLDREAQLPARQQLETRSSFWTVREPSDGRYGPAARLGGDGHSGPLPIAEISGEDRVSCARERKVEQPKVHHGVLANDRSGSRDIGRQNPFRGSRIADFYRLDREAQLPARQQLEIRSSFWTLRERSSTTKVLAAAKHHSG